MASVDQAHTLKYLAVVLVVVGAFIAVGLLTKLDGAIVVRSTHKAVTGASCTVSLDCESQICVDGYCREGNLQGGRKCLDNQQCVSKVCSGGVCTSSLK